MLNLLLVVVLVILDQLLKYFATQFLMGAESITIIPGFLGLNYVLNPGAGFSILSGQVDFLILVTSVALIAIAYAILTKKFETKMDEFCFVLILAGGIGNLIDRVLNGVVVDYLEFLFIEFPVFNFADILICCGVGLFMVYTIATEFFLKKKKETDVDER